MSKKKVRKLIALTLGVLIVFTQMFGLWPNTKVQATPSDYYSPYDVAYSPDGTMIAVSDVTKGKLNIITASTGVISKSILLNGQPKGVAWGSNTKVYVAEYDGGNVAEIDPVAGTVLRRFPTGPKPVGVAVKNNTLVVTDYGLGKVSVVDLTTGALLAQNLKNNVSVVDSTYSQSTNANKISVVDATYAQVASFTGLLGEIKVKEYPFFVDITTDGNFAIVGHLVPTGGTTITNSAASITFINLATRTVTSNIPLPTGSSNVRDIKCSPDGQWAYVVHTIGRTTMPTTQILKGWVNTDALTIINVAQKSIYTTVLLDTSMEGAADPWGVTVSPDNNTLWVSIAGNHQVYKVDLYNLHQLLQGNIPGIGSYYTSFDSTAQYRLLSKRSSKAIDVPGSSTTNGTQLIQYTYSGGNNQKWKIVDAGGGYYKIQNIATSKFIDNQGSAAEKAPVAQWDSSTSDNQKWSIANLGGGYYKFINKASGKALDTLELPGNNAGLVQVTSNATDGQQWQIVKIGDNAIPTLVNRAKSDYAKPYSDIWFAIKADPNKKSQLKNDFGALWSAGLLKKIKLPGQGPRGISISADGTKVAVGAYFAGAVYMINTATNTVTQTIPLGTNPAEDSVRRGERIFHDASTTTQEWLSCATCHPEGRADGLNWDMPNDGVGNPKNTKSMYKVFDTPPAMWRGIRADATTGVRSGFKFIKFREPSQQEVDDVSAYIKSFTEEVSPYRNSNGTMTADATAGKALFESSQTQCATCHSGPNLTDLTIHDVGTKDAYDVNGNYVTPPLVELWKAAPYLHDGSAATLMDVLTTKNVGNRHGITSNLTSTQLNQLVAYMLQVSSTSTPDTQAPTAPTNLISYDKTSSAVTLMWNQPTDNVGVTSYDILSGTTLVASTSSTSYTITGLSPNTYYNFTVKARDGMGNLSPASNLATVLTLAAPVNVALNKTATSDSTETGKSPASANDKDTTTRWCAANGNANHWLMVDLGSQYNLTGTEVMWEQPGKNYKYKIETSTNNSTWTVVCDKTNTTEAAQLQADTFAASGVRYVRITITGVPSGCWASLYEFRVFGTPVSGTAVTLSRSNMIATSTSYEAGNEPVNVLDNNNSTLWHTKFNLSNPLPQSITINLAGSYTINKLRYMPRQDSSSNGRITGYKVYVSMDGVNFGSPVATGTWAADTTQKNATFTAVTGRYIRLEATAGSGGWASAAEINIEGY